MEPTSNEPYFEPLSCVLSGFTILAGTLKVLSMLWASMTPGNFLSLAIFFSPLFLSLAICPFFVKRYSDRGALKWISLGLVIGVNVLSLLLIFDSGKRDALDGIAYIVVGCIQLGAMFTFHVFLELFQRR